VLDEQETRQTFSQNLLGCIFTRLAFLASRHILTTLNSLGITESYDALRKAAAAIKQQSQVWYSITLQI
jgi:hypothetical protein